MLSRDTLSRRGCRLPLEIYCLLQFGSCQVGLLVACMDRSKGIEMEKDITMGAALENMYL